MATILLVEDDAGIGAPLAAALTGQDYDVDWARDAAAAMASAQHRPADLVLLDLGLPDRDGVALCRQLRDRLPMAVIVILTARSEEVDVVVGLDAGADDYLVKPFRLAELLARLRAHLRRSSGEERGQVRLGGLLVDADARRVLVDGQEVPLRPKEFDLLETLVSHAGNAVSREDLMASVWDVNWFGSTKTLDMHVSSLRRKLAEAGLDPDPITTLRGYGYRCELPGPPEG